MDNASHDHMRPHATHGNHEDIARPSPVADNVWQTLNQLSPRAKPMSFFSAEFAYALQFITFPLEFIGLTLATIEVKFPGTAARIAQSMDDVTGRVRSVNEADQKDTDAARALWQQGKRLAAVKRFFADDYSNESIAFFFEPVAPAFKIIGPLLGFIVKLLLFGFIGLILLDFIFDSPAIDQIWSVLGALLSVFIYLLMLAILLFALWLLISFAAFFSTSFVEGRAVGTLGILLAGFGLLGEAYQFASQLVS
jgi:hypothetical protein